MMSTLSHPRFSLSFSPHHPLILTAIGNQLHLLPKYSYLSMLNSIELIKVNTSNKETLKIGESFYIYFHFMELYLGYDENEGLYLTKILGARTLFKILTEHFDWSSRGKIDTGNHFKYRIILAEFSEKFLANENGRLNVCSKMEENSLISFENSIYSLNNVSFPFKLISLETAFTLSCNRTFIGGLKKPSLRESMFSFEKETSSQLWAIKHVDLGSYLVPSGKEFVLLKDTPASLKNCYEISEYNGKGDYFVIKLAGFENACLKILGEGQLTLTEETLENIFYKQEINENLIKNVLVSAWLKSELSLESNNLNISYILEETVKVFEEFYSSHNETVVDDLINSKFIGDLDLVVSKYDWRVVGDKIMSIIQIILKIKESYVTELFSTECLYQRIMDEKNFEEVFERLEVNVNSIQDPHKVLKSSEVEIFKQKEVTKICLETLLIISPILKVFGKREENRVLREFMEYAVDQLVHQVQSKKFNAFYVIGLRLIKLNTTAYFFTKSIVNNISLQILNVPEISFSGKIYVLSVLKEEVSPYVYISTECSELQVSESIDKYNEGVVSTFLEDILPKNCRFESYENKLISLSVLPYWLKVNKKLDISDCKEYMKYLVETLQSFSYDEERSVFVKYLLNSFYENLLRVIQLICEKSLQYDSITQMQSERIEKCKKEFDEFVKIEYLGRNVWECFKEQQFQEIENEVFILALKNYEIVLSPQKYFTKYLSITKVVDNPTKEFVQIIQFFVSRQYEYSPVETLEKIVALSDGLEDEDLLILGSLIHENNIYEKVCFRVESFYKFINILSRSDNINESGLDGMRILTVILSRRGEWLYEDCEFIFLRKILKIVGGVISIEIYNAYEGYICGVQMERWSLSFFNLCISFFNMNPLLLKKRFVVRYENVLRYLRSEDKVHEKLFKRKEKFISAFLEMLLIFIDYHPNKEAMYEIVGDEKCFDLLEDHGGDTGIVIKILKFMIGCKKMVKEYEVDVMSGDIYKKWFRNGTFFIKDQLETMPLEKLQKIELKSLKEYTFSLIDFLKLREMFLEMCEIEENEVLSIEGTNKLLVFQIIDLVEEVSHEELERSELEKLQWFENVYKINVNSIELAHMVVEREENVVVENFVYEYKLEVDKSLEKPINAILEKIDIGTFIIGIVRIIMEISFDERKGRELLLMLNYLHCMVSQREVFAGQDEIKVLFLVMSEFWRSRKYKELALIQNILRKIIWQRGEAVVSNQKILQTLILDNKAGFNEFLEDCINNYMIFCPTYSKTSNYFNANGNAQINWYVTSYISMLRFLISLCKSLELEFKEIFSESKICQKEFIGHLIQLNEKHIEELQKETSETKLTLIAYEIELINNMMLGPVFNNIKTAIKFKYQNIISLIALPDLSENPERINYFKIVVKIKRLVSDMVLILSPFEKINEKDVRMIEDGCIIYFKKTCLLVKDRLDMVIENYTRENKNKIEIMNFDFALNLFFCLIRIYDREGVNTIKKMKTEALRKVRLTKNYNKKFKMFYQIYKILSEGFKSIGRCLYNLGKKTVNEMEAMNILEFAEVSHEENLEKVFSFFVKNVSNVEIQVGKEVETVHFLLLKETKCYNASIRKELHRNVGLGSRFYRLDKFMSQVNHVILRLEIEKSIRTFTEKYKPIEIIIKNRQLWKSMNFLCACILNFILFFLNEIPEPDVPLYFLRALSYLFCIFLYMIYFIQNLPLKRRLAYEMQKSGKISFSLRIKSWLEIINDKTLWFATIYFIVISLSIYQLGFVCFLMIDFFVRFKISKKVTEIVTRPIISLLLIVLFSAQIAFIFTCYEFFIGAAMRCVDTATCIQSTYEEYLGLFKNVLEDEEDFNDLKFKNITEFLFNFLTLMVNTSLIISTLLYEKKAKDNSIEIWEKKVKENCYICDSERNVVDRARNDNSGFFEHIEEEHNLWSYIFYLLYLKNKEVERLNVIESMVLSEWKENGIGWLPTGFKNDSFRDQAL